MATTTKQPFRWSASIGRIAGIDIRVHVTFLLLVLLVAAAAESSAAMVGNVWWIGLLFASIVAHELAHSLVARRRGATVRAIVLLPIGGVSELEHLPETPDDELRVAAAGPATSILLGLSLLALAAATGAGALPPRLAAGSLVGRLGWANLLLGGFNLLPAFPMDGGRIFQATLARRLDQLQATRLAAQIGRWLAVAMVTAGLFWDAWLVFIGVFVWMAGSAEETGSVVHGRLRGLRVGDLAVPVAPSFPADAGLDLGLALRPGDPVDPDGVAALARSSSGTVAVVDGGVVVGVLRDADLARAAGVTPAAGRPGARAT